MFTENETNIERSVQVTQTLLIKKIKALLMDLEKHFVKYEAVVGMIDQVFDRVKKEYPKEVFCREKCSD